MLVLRVGLSLGAVLGLIALLGRGARRGIGGRGPVKEVDVVARQGLARNASVVVVRAAGRVFLLGVTESSVSLVADLGHTLVFDEVAGTPPQPVDIRPKAWRDALESVREMTVRRS